MSACLQEVQYSTSVWLSSLLMSYVLQAKVASAQAKADKLAVAVSSWGGSMLRRAFTTWKERHASWQQGHAKVARAAALWHNRALAGAWQQWKESAIYQQELRLRLTGAVGESSQLSHNSTARIWKSMSCTKQYLVIGLLMRSANFLGSPVYYLASCGVNAKMCRLFCSFLLIAPCHVKLSVKTCVVLSHTMSSIL